MTHTTRELLEQQGEDPAGITVAHTALDALRRVRQTAFDVILLDIDLPDRDGDELAADLREENPEAEIVVLTGLSDDDERVLATVRSGSAGLIRKPIDGRDVASVTEIGER